jgi:hypothetical protein
MNAVKPQNQLRLQFQKELHTYYQMHGEKNHGAINKESQEKAAEKGERSDLVVDGVIYPPDIKAGDEVALQERVDGLSDYLAGQDGITYRQTPELGQGRVQDRAKVAAQASGWVKASGKVALQAATDLIQDPSIRAMVHHGLEEVHEDFFTAASSASGFFHPADEINEGGLALHTARVTRMTGLLSDYFGLNEAEKDAALAGAILHDGVKGGNPWERYANDHGELAGDLIQGLDGPEDAKKIASQMASNHMAFWRKTANNEPNPSIPDNKYDMIMSLADYLAARDDIYLDVPGAIKGAKPIDTAESHMTPNTYAGVQRNRVSGIPRGLKATFEAESVSVEINGKKYSGTINDPEVKDMFMSYGKLKPEFEGGRNEMEGIDFEAKFWLIKDRKAGQVRLTKGDKQAEMWIWNQDPKYKDK